MLPTRNIGIVLEVNRLSLKEKKLVYYDYYSFETHVKDNSTPLQRVDECLTWIDIYSIQLKHDTARKSNMLFEFR